MISHRWIVSLIGSFRSLARCRRGGFAMIYTLAAIPVFLAVGVSVDAARGYLMQTRLSNAIDAAALAAGSFTGTNNRDLSELAWEYFRSNYGINATFDESSYSYTGASESALPYASEITSPDGSVTLNISLQDLPDQANVIISARTDLPTTFMRLASINEMEVAAGVEVMRGQQGMELVLVMDNTGSMYGNSMTQMRRAARGLVNAIYTGNFDAAARHDSSLHSAGDDNIDTLRIGLVPYTATVNIGRGRGNQTWDDIDDQWETWIFDDSSATYTKTAVATDPTTDPDSYVHWLRGVPALALDPDSTGPQAADSPELQRVLGTDLLPFDPDSYFTAAPRSIRDRGGSNTGYYELECLHDDTLNSIVSAALDGDNPHDLSASQLLNVREEIMDQINRNTLDQSLNDARTLTDARVVDISNCALYSDTTYNHPTDPDADPITLLPPPGPQFWEDEPIYLPYDPEPYIDGLGVLQLDDMPSTSDNGDPRGWLGCVMARRNGLDVSELPPVLDYDGDGYVVLPGGSIDTDDLITYRSATEIDTDFDGLPDSGTGYQSTDITGLGASIEDTLFTPYRWISDHSDRYDNSENNSNEYNTWRLDGLDDGHSSDPLYWGLQPRRNDGLGPNLGCPPAITPLANNYTEVMDAIDEMDAWHRGGTYSNIGMAWGMRVLSPRWRSFWALRNDDGTPDEFEGVQFPLEQSHPNMMKVVVVMTDGTNQTFQDDFTSFGYLEDIRPAGDLSEHHGRLIGLSDPIDEANSRMLELCNAMRGTDPGMGINTPNVPEDDNIVIYSIVLGNGQSRDTFDACASADAFYYNVSDADQLVNVFQQISDSLTSLRLTN